MDNHHLITLETSTKSPHDKKSTTTVPVIISPPLPLLGSIPYTKSSSKQKSEKIGSSSISSSVNCLKKLSLNPTPKNTSGNNKRAQSSQMPLTCSSCSSNDVTQIDIKLRSCQNCDHVTVDEIQYSNETQKTRQTVQGGSQSYYHHLAAITKKLRSVYKSKNSHLNKTNDRTEQISTSSLSLSHVGKRYNCGSTTNRSEQSISNSINDGIIIDSTLPEENVAAAMASAMVEKSHDSWFPSRFVKNESETVVKNKISTELTNHNHNKEEALILKIKDLALKQCSSLLAATSESRTDTGDSLPPEVHYVIYKCGVKKSSMNNDSAHKKLHKVSRGTQSASSTLLKGGALKSKSPSIKRTTSAVVNNCTPTKSQPHSSAAVLSSTPESKTSSDNNQVSVEYRESLVEKMKATAENRRNILRKFKQSKSFDVVSSTENFNHTQMNNTMDNNKYYNNYHKRNNKSSDSYGFTSKSMNNLNDFIEKSLHGYEDDEGPFESINSVELIFISEEFLNKAVKHDLKILKCNKNKSDKLINANNQNNKFNTISTSSSSFRQSKKTHKTQQQKHSISNKSMLQKGPSPAGSKSESISPLSPLAASTSVKEKVTQSQISRTMLNSSKKLIVISEDFKRKSLENNIVNILDENKKSNNSILIIGGNNNASSVNSNINHNNNNSSTNIIRNSLDGTELTGDKKLSSILTTTEELKSTSKKSPNELLLKKETKETLKNIKEKSIMANKQQPQLSRQQSSIDDVGNQMVSHAFCSFEEPDEQCLENKDIKHTSSG